MSYWLKAYGSWSYQSVPVTVSNTTYTISVSGQIDDLRFHPANAQLTAYSYDSLIGMTGSSDANGVSSQFVYDDFLRLNLIKDNNGDILKVINYSYGN